MGQTHRELDIGALDSSDSMTREGDDAKALTLAVQAMGEALLAIDDTLRGTSGEGWRRPPA